MTQAVQIQVNKIPEVEARILAETFLAAVSAFYSNPQNVADFEAWKKQKEERSNNYAKNSTGFNSTS